MKVPIHTNAKTIESIQSADTYPHILEEIKLARANEIRFLNVMSGEPEVSKKAQSIRALKIFQSEVGYNPHDEDARAYVIWDLNLHSNGELYRLIPIPEEYRHAHIFKTVDGVMPAISATITPAGTITEPHIDQGGSGTLLFEIMGKKVFVIWPPTPKNLEWFAPLYGLHYGAFFTSAIEHLEQAECHVLEQGQHYLLQPGYIHGVLSATNSAVAGVPIVGEGLRSDANRTMDWESALVGMRKERRKPREIETVAGIEAGLEEDMELWRQLESLQHNMDSRQDPK